MGPREYSGFSGGVFLVCEGGGAGYFWRGLLRGDGRTLINISGGGGGGSRLSSWCIQCVQCWIELYYQGHIDPLLLLYTVSIYVEKCV